MTVWRNAAIGLRSPHRLHSLIPSTGLAVTLIGGGPRDVTEARQDPTPVLVIVLVIVLRRPEPAGALDRCDDGPAKCLFSCGYGCPCNRALFIVEGIDRGGIGVTAVAELAVGVGDIDGAQEDVHQRAVTYGRWIKIDPDRFTMPTVLVGLVGRVLGRAAGVARDGGGHPRHLVEIGLDAPEAAAGEDRGVGGSARRADRGRNRKDEGKDKGAHDCSGRTFRPQHATIFAARAASRVKVTPCDDHGRRFARRRVCTSDRSFAPEVPRGRALTLAARPASF